MVHLQYCVQKLQMFPLAALSTACDESGFTLLGLAPARDAEPSLLNLCRSHPTAETPNLRLKFFRIPLDCQFVLQLSEWPRVPRFRK